MSNGNKTCGACEVARKAREEQQKIVQNIKYSPRPLPIGSQSPQPEQPKPASSKFQSPTVLSPLK